MEFIHIGDTHFGPDEDLLIRGSNVCDRARQLVEEINSLSFVPDFVVHTGDVVNDPDTAAYELAAEALSALRMPVYYVTGNHDDVGMMEKALIFGPREDLLSDSKDRLCYQLTGGLENEAELFVLDGKVPPEEGPHGHLSDRQMDAVLSAITGEKPVAVFIHYPLTPIGSQWIDQHLLVTNGAEFQDQLATKAGENLRGIFSGHLHRGLQLYRHGVLQSGVSSPACEFTAGPEDDNCDFLAGGAIPFHHVTLTKDATMVKAYSIPFRDPR
ncbi:MAG: metallophosphoesterase [Verrucomicrobiales bacterium]|nr:metallophosphoesterase [Verrucomicrobiales bacterium]